MNKFCKHDINVVLFVYLLPMIKFAQYHPAYVQHCGKLAGNGPEDRNE